MAAFDSEIKQLVRGDSDSLKAVTERVSKLAQESKDAMASYYVRVLEKLSSNEAHVEKELARLQNILSKGGLVNKKADELTTKVNILLQFFTEQDVPATVEEGIKDEL